LAAIRAASNQLLVQRRNRDPLYADRRNLYKVEKWSRDKLDAANIIFLGLN
jgi:hypothetical protein